MIKLFTAAATFLALTSPAYSLDAAQGEKDFRSCKSCHAVVNGDDVIYKGGRTGPNLYGIIGRQAGTYAGYKYGRDIVAAGEAGLIWDEALLVDYVANPKAFLTDYLGESARSRMSFRKKDTGDIIAYLASVGPQMTQEEPSAVQAPEADSAESAPAPAPALKDTSAPAQ